MAFSRFPANPEALFTAAYEVYANIKIIEAKRAVIVKEINELSQVVPPPMERLRELTMQQFDLNDVIRRLSKDAQILTNIAVRGLIASSDVENALKALKCANGKAAMALNSLAQFNNFLAISTAYVEFVAAVASAAATAPASLLAIADVIDKFQKAVSIELEETLTEQELRQLRAILAENCVKSV